MKITFKVKNKHSIDEKSIYNVKKIEKTRDKFGKKEWLIVFNSVGPVEIKWRFSCKLYKIISIENDTSEPEWTKGFKDIVTAILTPTNP